MSIQNILSLLLKFVLDKGYTSQDYIEEGYSKEIIMDKLIRGFSLNREESSRYYERFAKPAR